MNPFNSKLVFGFACRRVTAYTRRHGDHIKTTLPSHSFPFHIKSIWLSLSSLCHSLLRCLPFFPLHSSWQPRHTWARLNKWADLSTCAEQVNRYPAPHCRLTGSHPARKQRAESKPLGNRKCGVTDTPEVLSWLSSQRSIYNLSSVSFNQSRTKLTLKLNFH